MAKNVSHQVSGKDMQTPPHKNSQPHTRSSANKRSKKPMKSNITNKVKSRHSAGLTPDESQDDDGEGGSSAIEESKSSAGEPDVTALSGAHQHVVGGAGTRLAGHDVDDEDMFNDVSMSDDGQAVGGASENDGSDDEGYNDLDDVSDSEGSEDEAGESGILRSAEQDLIGEYERTEERRNANIMTMDMNDMVLQEDEALARRLSLQGSDSQNDDFGFAVNMNEDPFYGFATNDNVYTDMWNEAESALWRMPESIRNRESSDPSSTTQKRVRFEEVRPPSSSRSDSEDPNDAFPDLFAASDHPMLKQKVANGVEHDASFPHVDFADAESFYDFEDEDEKLAFELDEESDSDDDSSSYDSDDEGDTTDEETREEQIARMHERKNAIANTPKSTPSTPLPAKRVLNTTARTSSTPRPTTPKDCKGPRAGTFAIDPTRATMTTDAQGRKIKMLPPAKPLEKDKAFWERARTVNSSRDGSPQNSYLTIPSPSADAVPPRPFTAQSTLGSMFNGNLDVLRNNDSAGVADDIFPCTMLQSQSSFTTMDGTEDSDTDRQDVNMQDFIELNDSDSDSDHMQAGVITSPTEADMFSSFASENGSTSRRGSGLLNHFDQYRGVVGSFRQNQHQVKHVSSLASHPAKRASAHEYNALQKGRRGAANTPMTPARKKRASQDLTPNGAGIRKSVNSPFAARRPRSRGNSLVGLSNADLYQTLAQNPFE